MNAFVAGNRLKPQFRNPAAVRTAERLRQEQAAGNDAGSLDGKFEDKTNQGASTERREAVCRQGLLQREALANGGADLFVDIYEL